MTYNESPTYQRFIEILADIHEAKAGLKSKMEASAGFIVSAMDRLQAEIGPAQKEADRWQGQLIAEEMNGKTTTKTALAAEAATNKLVKLEQSLRALSRTGGLAIVCLEKQIRPLNIRLRELKNEQSGVNTADSYTLPAPARKLRLARLDVEIKEVKEALSRLTGNLKVLKDAELKNGRLIIVDAGTQAAAEATIKKAVAGYVEIEKLLAEQIKEIGIKREQFDELKAELLILEEVRTSLGSVSIADQLYDCEIEAIVLPELYEQMNTVNEHQEVQDRDFLRTQLGSYLRRKAHGLS